MVDGHLSFFGNLPTGFRSRSHPSEQQLQGKLDLPRSPHNRGNGAGVGIWGAAATEGTESRSTEVGVVQNIEEFRSKLKSGRLGDPGILRQIDIQSRVTG